MAEVAAIGFFLGQIMEIVGPLLLAKHCAEVGNDLVHRRRPKIKNIVAILMGGFEIVDPDILPTEAFTDKLSNFVVKNFHYIDPAVTPAIIAEGKGSAIDMLAELRKLISENPDIIGFKYGEIVLNPEQFNASKALLTTLLQGPVELGVDGVEAFAFKQLINSLSGESSTDEDIGNIFTVTMLPFIDHCKQLFSKMDKDKNGYISKDELKPWLANFSDRTGVLVRGADGVFSSLDKDQDGKIDFAEFISWQFIIYLHQTHKYCDSCKRCFIEGAEGNKCMHSTTGQHITKHTKNYLCAHTTHKHVNLPYSVCNVCHSSCSSNGNTACYYCVECDHTVCLECEEINGEGDPKIRMSDGIKWGYYNGKFNSMGQMHGYGKMKYDDGSLYEGSWKNNLKEGSGTLYYSSGPKLVGNWVRNKINGSGTYYYPDGKVDLRMYRKDEIIGAGVQYSLDRQVASKLKCGRVKKRISLTEASKISSKLGLTVPG